MTMQSDTSLIERIQNTLAEALRVPIDLLTAETAFGDMPQWDSLGHMEVMMFLEQEFGIEINADTIASLTSVPAIYAHITNSKEV